MRRLLAGISSVALVLALGTSVRAQDRNASNRDANNNTGEARTIRGVIAGVTVEGETVIDYQTRQAVAAQMTYITVVGSPVRDQDRSRDGRNDRDRDNARDNRNNNDRDNSREARNDGDRSGRRRHNVYVLWLSPRTKVRDTTSGDRQNAKDASWENLEIGDRVEVTYTGRDTANTANANANNAQTQKHGRHRTYFGDANTITILAEPSRRDGDSNRDSDRNSNQNRDSDRNSNQNRDSDRNSNQNRGANNR